MSRENDAVTEWLLDLYRRHLGEPEQLSVVYAGFGLFFAGVAFAAIGMAVFLWSGTFPTTSGVHWQLREVAVALTMVGLPSFLLGVVVLLGVDRRLLLTGGAGWLVGLSAVGIFVANYPHNWNVGGSDATAVGVSVYALGLVLSTAAVGAALVSTYISQSGPGGREAVTDEAGAAEADAETESVTNEQVRADIDEAMSKSELSWGGVEKDNTKRLNLRTDDAEDIDRSGFDNASANVNRAAGTDVDNAVDELGKLRGGNANEATGEGTDDQADALRQLREQQARDSETTDQGVVTRLKEQAESLRERIGR